MMRMPRRFKLVFFPFFGLAAVFVSSFSLLHWFLYTRTGIYATNPDWAYEILPGLVAVIILLLWFRSLQNKLTCPFDRKKTRNGFVIIGVILLTSLNYCVQILIEDHYSGLVRLQDIADFRYYPKAKYITVEHYQVNTDLMGQHVSIHKHTLHGKYSSRRSSYGIAFYVVAPVFSGEKKEPSVWIGIKFDGRTAESWSESKLKEDARDLLIYWGEQLQHMSFKKISYLERITDRVDLSGFQTALKNSPLKNQGIRTVMLPCYKPFQSRIAEDLSSCVVVLIFALLIWFTMVVLLITTIDDALP